MRSPGLAHLPLAPGLCTNWHSTSTGPKTSFLVAGGFAVFPIRGPASSVSAGRGGPCRLALQRPRVAITTPAGLWTPEHEPQAAIEAGGCGRRPHRCLPGTPDPDSAPQESAEAANMPIFKCPQKSEPLWKEWDQKAQKNGLRHQVFAVNGDHYVGEWKDNVKHDEEPEAQRVKLLALDQKAGFVPELPRTETQVGTQRERNTGLEEERSHL
ncbi:MORN repeat-containing protein 3 isoform X3 [Bos taurus]|uniref:MORN repeat-containing protein 3 isoform X3 n=1 Tax=Bos taurus TaxID=9913 RepID=UPI0028CB6A4D|nr:MORN repeat-containing protein 3 isoform X3 [Bos taurus]